jgi:hypothetical protein
MGLLKYKAVFTLFILCMFSFSYALAQEKGVVFSSSDKDLERAFIWAKKMALHYKGKTGDPVGPWYESALPPRDAFCMRDVSHQCIGAEILGLKRENNNMFNLFAGNISASKNWCSYWEITEMIKSFGIIYLPILTCYMPHGGYTYGPAIRIISVIRLLYVSRRNLSGNI